MMRDLNDLNFFAAVVDHGGFSAAARALAVPKSRVSRRITALETQLGVRLLERSTRRFRVTDVGQDVYRHARAAMTEAEAVQEVAARLKAEPQGLVRVSCPQGAERLMAVEFAPFLKRFPRLRVQLIVTNRRVDLIEEGIDVAIRAREALDTDAELQVKIIGRTGRILVASPALFDTHARPITPAELASLPTISQTERPGVDRWTFVDAANKEEVVLHEPRFAAGELSVLRQAAIDGIGLAFLPELLCRASLDNGRLERVLPDWSGHDGILHLVFTSRRGLLPGVRAVIDFVAEVLAPNAAACQRQDA